MAYRRYWTVVRNITLQFANGDRHRRQQAPKCKHLRIDSATSQTLEQTSGRQVVSASTFCARSRSFFRMASMKAGMSLCAGQPRTQVGSGQFKQRSASFTASSMVVETRSDFSNTTRFYRQFNCGRWVRGATFNGPTTVMAENGHVRSHCRQPTQSSLSTFATQFTTSIERASVGQRMTHSWQPTQRSLITLASGFDISFILGEFFCRSIHRTLLILLHS